MSKHGSLSKHRRTCPGETKVIRIAWGAGKKGDNCKPSQRPYLGAERGCRHIEEGGGALRRHGLGEHRLARAWRPVWRRGKGRGGPVSFRLQFPSPYLSLFSSGMPPPPPPPPISFSLFHSLYVYISLLRPSHITQTTTPPSRVVGSP